MQMTKNGQEDKEGQNGDSEDEDPPRMEAL